MRLKPIGGFFGLESVSKMTKSYHSTIALTTGRACLNVLIRKFKPEKIYVPYYTCDSLLEPLVENNVRFDYYAIDHSLDPAESFDLRSQEYLLYINYFGIKGATVQGLLKRYKSRLMIDNTQAFFEKGYPGAGSFNSVRKFFGVPDGAYLYSPVPVSRYWEENHHISMDHLLLRDKGKDNLAYKKFVLFEKSLTSQIMGMFSVSKEMLKKIDYRQVVQKRRRNFQYLHKHLSGINMLKFRVPGEAVAHSYPFLPEQRLDRKIFFREKIFIPTFWERKRHVVQKGFDWEKTLSRNLLPLPIDQRYDMTDLKRILNFIDQLLRK